MSARATWADRVRWIVPLVGLVVLGVLFVELGPRTVLSLLGALGWSFPIVVGIFMAHEGVRALVLNRLLMDDSPSYARLLQVRFASEAVRTLTHTGPFVSQPARGWLLTRQGLTGEAAYGAAASEFIANSWMSSAVTAVALIVVFDQLDPGPELTIFAQVLLSITSTFVVVTAVAIVGRIYVIGAIARGISALPLVGSRLRVAHDRVRNTEEMIFRALRDRPATVAQVALLELIAQALLVLEIYWVLQAMGVPIPASRALLVEALTKVANLIQFVGVAEGGYALVFAWLGLSAAAGFALSLVRRIRSLVGAAVGLAVVNRMT